MRTPIFRILIVAVVCLAIGEACRPRRSLNEKRYDMKGKVVAVSESEGTVTIAHEDIVGYMPAMTMPFRIKPDSDLEKLKTGDQITGTLVVDDLTSSIEVTTIIEGASLVPQFSDVPGEPKAGDLIPHFARVN